MCICLSCKKCLADGARDEVIARPVTGHTIHDESSDWIATGHTLMRGQPPPTWAKELECGNLRRANHNEQDVTYWSLDEGWTI